MRRRTHTGRSSRIDQANGQTPGSTEEARETKRSERGVRAMQKGKYWKLHQRRCNQPYTRIHKQLPQRARGRQMKRARRWESGGTAMGIITRFICNIPSPFPAVTTVYRPFFGLSPYDLFSVSLRRRSKNGELPILLNLLCHAYRCFSLFYFFFLPILFSFVKSSYAQFH